MDDPIVVKEPIYFNIFECGKNILNRLDAMCKRACMATPRDKYHTELYRTITYCNDCNGAPFPMIRFKIKYIESFYKRKWRPITSLWILLVRKPVTPNKQGENKNTIFTSEKQNNSDALVEMLEGLTINDAGYY